MLQAPMSTGSCEFYDDFSTDTGRWTYAGNGAEAYRDVTNEYVVLTEDAGYVSGVMWLNTNIKADTMIMEFRYKAAKENGRDGGADGFVMMFYKDKNYTPAAGGGLGFLSAKSNNNKGYGIEFDSYLNSNFGDTSSSHIALIENSVSDHLKSVDSALVNGDIWHNARIEIDNRSNNENVKVYVDNMNTAVLEWSGNLNTQEGGLGFGGATGGRTQAHIIDDVRITIPGGNFFTVTSSSGSNGTVDPNGERSAQYGDSLSYTLIPDENYVVASVTGTCGGTLSGTEYTTNEIKENCSVIANFSQNRYTLEVVNAGSRQGTVNDGTGSNDDGRDIGIYCGSNCTETYDAGTTVTLTVSPEADISFEGWSGACEGKGACVISMNSDTVVTATFGPECEYGRTLISEDEYFQYSGDLVTTNGDFDGDGHQDLAYGYYLWDFWHYTKGKVEILYGPDYQCTTSFGQDSPGIAGGGEDSDWFGHALASGDINGDGYNDLVIGIPGENNDTGYISVIYGSIRGLTDDGNVMISQGTSGIAGTPETGDKFGWSLASGDFNGDDYADVAIGVPGEDNGEGWVNIIYGAYYGLKTSGDQLLGQDSDGIDGRGEKNDKFGYSLASGDFDNDGYSDLVIGVPFEDIESVVYFTTQVYRCTEECNQYPSCPSDGLLTMKCTRTQHRSIEDVGSINIIYGSGSGLTADHNHINSITQDTDGVLGGAESGDWFGFSLASGDFNGNGYYDIAIGVPGENNDKGEINVIYGSKSGLTASGDLMFGQSGKIGGINIAGGGEEDDFFGWGLASGDFDGNGYSDISVWVPGENNEGWINFIFGSNTGLTGEGNYMKKAPFNPWK